jgi:hypothetical protein
MSHRILQFGILVLQLATYAGMPLATIWGWLRLAKRTRIRSLSAMLSLIGFVFATASLILGMLSLIYAHLIHGFAYYDPLLLRIYSTGALFSLLGLIFSLGGVWRPNWLRWHAAVCSSATLLFWLASAMGE